MAGENFYLLITLFCRHMRISADLNNMSWRIRPDEVIFEHGRAFGSKMALHKLSEVRLKSLVDLTKDSLSYRPMD